jgi:hypothetical protein
MRRYAIVRGFGITADKVAAYLPRNYRVEWAGKCDWHKSAIGNTWKQHPGMEDEVVVISGIDSHGWTLDRYVAPRLGSGMMRCDECDLSHPIMSQIPA